MAIAKSDVMARHNSPVRIFFTIVEPIIDARLDDWRTGSAVTITDHDLKWDQDFSNSHSIWIKEKLIEYIIQLYKEKGWSVSYVTNKGEPCLRFI